MMVVYRTIGADRMMVVMPITVIPIQEWINAMVWMPPMWIVSPIVWRMPTYPRRPPEPIVDHWTIDIYRLDDIVLAIDILVTHYLYGDLILLVFLHKDRRHILVNILCQDGLNHHQVAVVIGCFDHT
jgi:hypothetical protein